MPQTPQKPNHPAQHDPKHDDRQGQHKPASQLPPVANPNPPRPGQPEHQPHREDHPQARRREPEALPIGAKPSDPKDPQAAKFEAHAAPPRWDDPKDDPRAREEWTPEPALDPRQQKPPEGYFADGMSAPDEQRARAAWVEQHGVAAYEEEVDQRRDDERPKFDKDALAGGGAFVTAGTQRQVPGVVPPTKRE